MFDKNHTGAIDVGELKDKLPGPKKDQYTSSVNGVIAKSAV